MNYRLAIGSPCLQPLSIFIVFEIFPACTNSTVKSFRRVIIQFISLLLNPKNLKTVFMKAKDRESNAFRKSMASMTPLLLLLLGPPKEGLYNSAEQKNYVVVVVVV